MRTNFELAPLSFPRSWFPFENLVRAITWLLVVELLNLVLARLLNVTDAWNHLFMLGIGFLCTTPVMSLLAPARLTAPNIPKSVALAAIAATIEKPRFGFAYRRSQSGDEWHLSRGNFLYPWNPSIRIDESGPSLVLHGPHLVLKSISLLLERGPAHPLPGA